MMKHNLGAEHAAKKKKKEGLVICQCTTVTLNT